MRIALRFGVGLGLVLLLVACPLSSSPTATSRTSISTFEASSSVVARGDEVTLTWVATGAGAYPGVRPCSMARRVDGEEAGEAFEVACSGSLTEVPPASPSAAYVRYQLNVLKDPYDPSDPYVTAAVTVDIDDSGAVPEVVSVSIDQGDLSLTVGDEVALTASVDVRGGASTVVTWASTDTTVLEIHPDTGVATATGEGQAEVTATSVVDGARSDAIVARSGYGPFGDARVLADATGPRGRNDRDFLAVDGARALVSRTEGRGSVEVYERSDDGTWGTDRSLYPPVGDEYSGFGASLDLSGDTAVASVTRRVATDPDVYEAELHVFVKSPTNHWTPLAVLLSGQGARFVDFALGDGVLVVGLPSKGLGGESAVRIYERDEGGPYAWGLSDVLSVPPTLSGVSADMFATDVDISGDGARIAVVSSDSDWDQCFGEAVFVYERTDSDPSQWEIVDVIDSAELRTACSAYVEIDGDVVAVSGVPFSRATVQIFERGDDGSGAWEEVRYREFDVPDAPDTSLYISQASMRLRGTTVVLGFAGETCFEDSPDAETGCAPGEVRVLNRDVGGVGAWGVSHVLRPDPGYADQGFGAAVDVSGDGRIVVVGTNPGPAADPIGPGEAYVVER